MTRTGKRVGVIGAGVAGLACARALASAGFEVRVFERARTVGGRCAARRAEPGFDHGAQYFTARDARFVAELHEPRAQGAVAPWSPRIVTLTRGSVQPVSGDEIRLVGVPDMRALPEHLAAGLTIALGCDVARIEQQRGRWRLRDAAGTAIAEGFDALALAVAAPQALPLVRGLAPALAATLERVEMAPCQALLVELESELDPGFDAGFVEGSAIAWLAREASKPGRGARPRWLLHASPEWSAARLDAAMDAVRDGLLDALAALPLAAGPRVRAARAHRWRFARTIRPAGQTCLAADPLPLVLCGDWCLGARVESAWQSGVAAARKLAESMS